MKGLTEKQRRMLDFIEDFMSASSMAPTVYEIADNFKIKTSTVFAHLRALQRKNFLTRSSKARSISLTKPRKKAKRQAANPALPIPIIGGAGANSLQKTQGEAKGNELFIDSTIVGGEGLLSERRGELFALRIQGQGLKELGILDGDIVVVNPSRSVKSGDLVVRACDGLAMVQSYAAPSMETLSGGSPALSISATQQNAQDIKGVVVALQRKI